MNNSFQQIDYLLFLPSPTNEISLLFKQMKIPYLIQTTTSSITTQIQITQTLKNMNHPFEPIYYIPSPPVPAKTICLLFKQMEIP